MEEIYNKIIENVKELVTISNEARLKIQVTILFSSWTYRTICRAFSIKNYWRNWNKRQYF